MNQFRRVLIPVTTCTCLLLLADHLEAATVRLVAVAVNEQRFDEPQSEVEAYPGDRIEVEILVSGWGTEMDYLVFAALTLDNAAIRNLAASSPDACGSVRLLNADVPDLAESGCYSDAASPRGVCSADSEDAGRSCIRGGYDCGTRRCVGGPDDGLECGLAAECAPAPCAQVTCEAGQCVDGMCLGGANAGRVCVQDDNQCHGGTCEPRVNGAEQAPFSSFGCVTDLYAPNYELFWLAGDTPNLEDPSRCEGGTNAGGPCAVDDDCPGGVCHLVETYFATLVLEVGEASGTAWYDLDHDAQNLLLGEGGSATIRSIPLKIDVHGPDECREVGACCLALGKCADLYRDECEGAGGVFVGSQQQCGIFARPCDCPSIVAADPANCENDARWPYRPDDCPASPTDTTLGLDSVVLTLSGGSAIPLTKPDDFVYQVTGGDRSVRPCIKSVEWLGGRNVRVDFDRPLPAFRWSCLGLSCQDEGPTVCWGRLPGDVDNSGRATVTDVLQLIDGLNGIIDLEPYQCDIDHSGVCNAIDILAEIDWLNGVTCFSSFTGLPSPGPCPTAP